MIEVTNLQELRTDRFTTNALRIKNQDELIRILSRCFSHNIARHWVEVFSINGIPAGLINSVPEALADPSIVGRKLVFELPHKFSSTGCIPMVGCPIKFSTSKMNYALPPPMLGEHTEIILKTMGYSDKDIEKIRFKNII